MAFRAVHSTQMGLMRIGIDVLRRFGELVVAHVALQALRLDSLSVFGGLIARVTLPLNHNEEEPKPIEQKENV